MFGDGAFLSQTADQTALLVLFQDAVCVVPFCSSIKQRIERQQAHKSWQQQDQLLCSGIAAMNLGLGSTSEPLASGALSLDMGVEPGTSAPPADVVQNLEQVSDVRLVIVTTFGPLDSG